VAAVSEWEDEATRVYTGKSPAEAGVMGTGAARAIDGPPAPATMPLPVGSQALQPARELVDIAETTLPPVPPPAPEATVPLPPGGMPGAGLLSSASLQVQRAPAPPVALPPRPEPVPAPRAVPSPGGREEETDTETWVFSDSAAEPDGIAAPAAPGPRRRQRPDGAPRKRRRRKKRSRPVSPLLTTLLVVAILLLLCALLLVIAIKQNLIGDAGSYIPSLEDAPLTVPDHGVDQA